MNRGKKYMEALTSIKLNPKLWGKLLKSICVFRQLVMNINIWYSWNKSFFTVLLVFSMFQNLVVNQDPGLNFAAKSISLCSNGAVFGLRIVNPCTVSQLLASFTEALASKDFDLDIVLTWYLVSWSLIVFFGNSREVVLDWPLRPLLVWIIVVVMAMEEACEPCEASKNSLSFVSRLEADNVRLKDVKWRLRSWQSESNAGSNGAARLKRTCSSACCRS